ncbi:MAG: 5'/3'-nucleotidase SurE [Kiritimatiellae bacterium]|nr:5'/3'-nucleotidase SurE [Kiritimatiellia bacterium]
MSPEILVSNDDGFHAPGLTALYRAAAGLGKAIVVAPAAEQSGVGHAITVFNPLKVRKHKFDGKHAGYSVNGTPADCVKIACGVLLRRRPALVVSGVNLGPNVGISVIYSGTVSAAAEGAILGVPSMAVSLDTFKNPRWDTAARIARLLAGEIMRRGLPPATMLNVNIPNLPLKKIKGLAITRMGRSRFAEVFHRRIMPRGGDYYWLDGVLEPQENLQGTDIQAVKQGYVSITPVTFDLTNRAVLPELAKWDLKLFRGGRSRC